MFGKVVQHQIQCLIFASQQRNVSSISHISNAKNAVKLLHKLNQLTKMIKRLLLPS